MEVWGFPFAMILSNSLSDFAEVAAETRFPGLGERKGALAPSPLPSVP